MQRRWKDVRVGDFIQVRCNEVIPADILLLFSSDPSGICHLETANLDGETNLKQRRVVKGFSQQVGLFPRFSMVRLRGEASQVYWKVDPNRVRRRESGGCLLFPSTGVHLIFLAAVRCAHRALITDKETEADRAGLRAQPYQS